MPTTTDNTDKAGHTGPRALFSPLAGLLRSRLALLAWFLVFALVTRASILGDLSYHEDELLFFYIGQRMHDGLLPYVDIWDRKPPTLFLLYYLIAGISRSVIAYQLAAMVFAALTAFVITLIAERFADRLSGCLAGSLYLAMLLEFGGAGGQAAVFFNLLMAIAALLVITHAAALRRGAVPAAIPGAMACAGLAITFKQTAVFEGIFLGCFVLWQYSRSGKGLSPLLRLGAALALIGAAPMLAWGAFYAGLGHFGEFWHAMVTANLRKTYNPGGDYLNRAMLFAAELAPVILMAVAGLARRQSDHGAAAIRMFIAGWLAAALVGFLIIPNLIDHYVLPVFVPLAIAASGFLKRKPVGTLIGIGLIALFVLSMPTFDYTRGARSRAEMLELVSRIRVHDPQMRLLVFDGPVYLYPLTGTHPPTPLVFPLHLNARPEADVSHLETTSEFRKLIAWRPGTVIFSHRSWRADLYNPVTQQMARTYVQDHCRSHFRHRIHDMYGPVTLSIYSNCTR